MIKGISYTSFNFPCGEKHVKIISFDSSITFEFEKNEDIIELLLLADALKREGNIVASLTMPYVPFSRQDRVCNSGEPFSLKVFADLINQMGFDKVIVTDPHSDVVPALINKCVVIPQHEIFQSYFMGTRNPLLICPDGGALKKIYKLAESPILKAANAEVIECSKIRDTFTGTVTGTKVHATNLRGCDCYIVDDICDGGGTFVSLAKELKKINPGRIILMVTHGFFTKGLQVFDDLIDEIYTRKGRVK